MHVCAKEEHDSQWECHQSYLQAQKDRFGTLRCLNNHQAASKCWIGSAAKVGHWLKCQAICKARHVSEPKWFSWRLFQVESSLQNLGKRIVFISHQITNVSGSKILLVGRSDRNLDWGENLPEIQSAQNFTKLEQLDRACCQESNALSFIQNRL